MNKLKIALKNRNHLGTSDFFYTFANHKSLTKNYAEIQI